ncbi:hypothetical protein DCO57_22040 [Labrenzia sp. 011]|nr:hypothetical protein DCO57_22040 [Labrenzia sp. 011]
MPEPSCRHRRRKIGGRLLRRPQQDYPAATVVEFCTADLSQMGRFETNTLTAYKNLAALVDLSGKWINRVQRLRRSPNLILDIDSSESPVHGNQEGSAYNGHFAKTCYHPLFVFNQHGDLERCALRSGNTHSADNWRTVLDPIVKHYRWSGLWRKYLRDDAAFAIPELLDYLEANGFGYAIWLKANKVLQRRIAYLLKRRPGRPSNKIERHYANITTSIRLIWGISVIAARNSALASAVSAASPMLSPVAAMVFNRSAASIKLPAASSYPPSFKYLAVTMNWSANSRNKITNDEFIFHLCVLKVDIQDFRRLISNQVGIDVSSINWDEREIPSIPRKEIQSLRCENNKFV